MAFLTPARVASRFQDQSGKAYLRLTNGMVVRVKMKHRHNGGRGPNTTVRDVIYRDFVRRQSKTVTA